MSFQIIFSYSTFVCPTEIIAFSDRIDEFKKINTEVVACSVDSVFTHLAWYVAHEQTLILLNIWLCRKSMQLLKQITFVYY